jgi:predicted 2-oxoglutarate/Fe(II)-dependent dioxygenase YbiX
VDAIKLRRVQASGTHHGCIDFHLDCAQQTMQIALNNEDEYVGGRLVFANGKGLHRLSRLAGAVTVHDNKVVHGVTALRAGVRYGLFFQTATADMRREGGHEEGGGT